MCCNLKEDALEKSINVFSTSRSLKITDALRSARRQAANEQLNDNNDSDESNIRWSKVDEEPNQI